MVHELGTVEMVCPFPLIEAQNKMDELQVGEQLKIDFDCTQATEALPNWAAENGYPVTNYEQLGDASWTITVEKQ
ncbi:sulfurtransferase TusA family protein [Mammaliicoccus sciuri]|uniref:sulfurtransferase TusA family protein n=1 Tax=Mammaliicoccus sciuri TaxID=1296 RepID=UPI000D1EC1E3|nr:sulfurtransferase TusA family protein [Mammaliicoccus sciuri]PTK09201.1 oxidoreductase [Mammaliicoccus sciuri]